MTKYHPITTGSLAMSSSPIGWPIGIDSPASPCIRGFQFRWEQKVKVEGQRAWNTSTTDCSKPLDLSPNPRVLDAGCGFGGTIFHWHSRLGGSYDGLTLSRVQLRVARREARRRGIDADCRFHLQSYDAPIAGTFDAVVAIESLIHSRDLNTTIPNLAKSLRPGGLMVLLDDMAEVNLDSEAPDEARALRIHWGCARYAMQEDYKKALDNAGMNVIREENFTAQVQPRNAAVLDKLEATYNRLYKVIRLTSARTVLSAYLGGLALERLYLKKEVCYRLIVARNES